MKSLFSFITVISIMISFSYAQTNTFPLTGSVGVGTVNPLEKLTVANSSPNAMGIYRDLDVNEVGSAATSINLGARNGNTFMAGAQINGVLSYPATNGFMTFATLTSGTLSTKMIIDVAGNVGIGTATPHEALSVNGNIRSKQIVVEATNWPDYVFNEEYTLMPLSEVKAYIGKNQHLPEMPSEKDVTEKGLNLGEVNKLLTKKVEELTLYLIDLQEQMKLLKKQQEQQAEKFRSDLLVLKDSGIRK